MSDDDKGHIDVHPGKRPNGVLRYVPYFFFILVLYVVVKLMGLPLHSPLGTGDWAITWVEVFLILAAVLALAEQMKVSHPGIDNTTEALTMVFMGIAQLVLFVLGVAKVPYFGLFNDFSFLVQTILSLSAAVVAVMINARTLRRTMALGDS
jgi:hypothetical protein